MTVIIENNLVKSSLETMSQIPIIRYSWRTALPTPGVKGISPEIESYHYCFSFWKSTLTNFDIPRAILTCILATLLGLQGRKCQFWSLLCSTSLIGPMKENTHKWKEQKIPFKRKLPPLIWKIMYTDIFCSMSVLCFDCLHVQLYIIRYGYDAASAYSWYRGYPPQVLFNSSPWVCKVYVEYLSWAPSRLKRNKGQT